MYITIVSEKNAYLFIYNLLLLRLNREREKEKRKRKVSGIQELCREPDLLFTIFTDQPVSVCFALTITKTISILNIL